MEFYSLLFASKPCVSIFLWENQREFQLQVAIEKKKTKKNGAGSFCCISVKTIDKEEEQLNLTFNAETIMRGQIACQIQRLDLPQIHLLAYFKTNIYKM